MPRIKQIKNYYNDDNTHAFYDFPIWEVKDFVLPELRMTRGAYKDYPNRYEADILEEPKHIDNFVNEWMKNFKSITDKIIAEDLPVLDQMWKGRFSNLNLEHNKAVEFTCDAPGFFMGPHFDNRNVVGVLIINLQDNIHGSTYFDQIDYTSPTKKHQGVFFLNHNNTTHSIDWKGQGDRFIGYHTLQLEDICTF